MGKPPKGNGFFWKLAKADDFYRKWRDDRLKAAEWTREAGFVQIENLANPTESERFELMRRCSISNIALYQTDPDRDPHPDLRDFATTFDLQIAEKHRSADGDGIVALRESTAPAQAGYIPYSKRGMGWHTDGYYNASDDRISAMVLHTARPADDGGANQVLDHTIACIRLMDEDPAFVRALMSEDAMTIPPDSATGRPASIGPVFYPDPDTGALQMRYTARTRSIVWKEDPLTREAVACLAENLADDPLTITLRFAPGQGVLCNNVLHDRTGFDADADTSRRLVYRVRFHNRVKGT